MTSVAQTRAAAAAAPVASSAPSLVRDSCGTLAVSNKNVQTPSATIQRVYNLEARTVHAMLRYHLIPHALLPPARPSAYRLPAVSDVSANDNTLQDKVEVTESSEKLTELKESVVEVNSCLLDNVLAVETDAPWKLAKEKDGIKMYTCIIQEFHWPHHAGPRNTACTKFEAVKAVGIINAPPKAIFDLFDDNEKIHEYNEFCNEIHDVVRLDKETKITWGATSNVGPFSPRDFVTRCYNTQIEDESYIACNVAEDLECQSFKNTGKEKKYVRMEILLGASIVRPVEGDPTKSEYTVICHTNPGGTADSYLGAQIMNMVQASGPFNHMKAIEQMAIRESS